MAEKFTMEKQDFLAMILVTMLIIFFISIIGGMIAGAYIYNAETKAELNQCKEYYNICKDEVAKCRVKNLGFYNISYTR